MTTGLVTKISEQLASEIESLVSKHGIVVWYDEAGVFSEIFDTLDIEDVRKVRFNGSFLEVRWKIEEADPELEGRWLIYIPRPKAECNWLREFELIGVVFQPDLAEILKTKYRLTFGKEEEQLLKGTQPLLLKIIEKRPEEIRKEDLGSYSHILDLILAGVFDEAKYDIDTIVLKYLQDPKQYATRIASHNLQEQFLTRIKEEYGIDSGGLEELRYDIARSILFSDFYQMKNNKDSFRFINLLPTRSKISVCASLAEKWRQHGAFKQQYIEFANRIEKEYGLEEEIDNPDDIVRVQTFKKMDELILKLVMAELAKKPVAQTQNLCSRLLGLSEIRRGMFWTKEGYLAFWDAVWFGAKVVESASMISARISDVQDSERLIKSYIDEWWQTDYHYRKFAESYKTEGPRLDELRIRVDYFYETFVETVNRAFSSSLEKVKEWRFEGTTRQDRFWNEIVSPITDRPIAVFMVDALRLELGKELAERMREDYNVELRTFLAVPPTITEVGMVAILPAKSELSFLEKNGKFCVGYESVLKNREDRVAWLMGVDENAVVLKITDVLRSDLKDLEKKVKGKNRIIVTSKDIDSMGESLETISLGVFSEVLKDLDNAVRRLTSIGIGEFAIIADHGFLYTKTREEQDKVDHPKGDLIYKSKRFVIGRNLASGSYHKLTTDQIGVNGGYEAAFPRGIACFRHPGGDEYIHGGLSLQEILIPCIILESRRRVEGKKLRVSVDFPARVTNLIFNVVIGPAGQLLLGQEGREVEVLVTSDDVALTEPIRKTIASETVSVTVRLRAGQLSTKPKNVLISVRDASTKEVLHSKQVPLDVIFDELGL